MNNSASTTKIKIIYKNYFVVKVKVKCSYFRSFKLDLTLMKFNEVE